MTVEKLITDNIDIWSSALQTRSTAGRGSNGKIDLYGIKKLRELILELAVRGKLVPQDQNDEPASELLKRIAAEKAELVKQGKIKKQKPLPEISEGEKPFELPKGWEWVRMDHVGHDWGQKTPENDFTYIDVGSINKELGIVADPTIIQSQDAPSRARKIVRRNTVVYSTVRPYLLNIAVINEDFQPEPIASTAFAIVHPWKGISATFIYHYLRSPVFINYVENCQTGIAYPAINDKQFFAGVVAIPPSEEQLRIVDKVNDLMSLCDQLEQQSLTSLDAHSQLVETLLATLTDSQNAEELAENWARISQHFDTLFTTEASIDALKQTILQLAVMGKLVPQDPNDEPASELLKRIEQEKKQLVKEGKIKKQKPLLPISDEEKPFELPIGWEWVRLGSLCEFITSGSRGWNQFYSDDGAIFIRSQDIKFDRLEFDNRAYVKLPLNTEGTRTRVEFGDLLMTITGGNVAKVAIVDLDLEDAYVSQHVALIRLVYKTINSYIHAWLICEHGGRKHLLDISYGAKPGLNLKNINDLLIPFAPEKQQENILMKVNELMSLCDNLNMVLQSAQQTQLYLANAFTDAALN